MKKAISIVISVLLMMSALSLAAFAAEDDGMVPVVVKVPEGWDAPHAWAWADDGTNAFAAWPGEELEPLAEGWYYIYVPGFVQNVIVSANQGTDAAVQTDGIVVEAGKETWITVAEDAAASVSYEAQLRGEIPAYVEKFVAHVYVPLSWKTVNLWAWSAPDGTNAFEAWPGAAMKEGEDGWFTGKVPTWVNSLIVNGNEGTVQTEDISIEAKELWITVYEDLTYELSYEDPNKAVDNITVYVQVPGWINSLIINGNEGAVQTTDLSVETGKDVWIVVTDSENAAVSYEEPAAQPTVPEAAGSHTGLIIGIVAAVAVLGGGTAILLAKKKKK